MTITTQLSRIASGRSVPTVLVVDDNAMLRLALAHELDMAGFSSVEAGSADEAETILQAMPVDLIVTDVEMPGSHDGLALAAFVRTHFPRIPVIVVSGKAPRASAEHVADAFFPKPYDIARLIHRAMDLLRGQGRGNGGTASA